MLKYPQTPFPSRPLIQHSIIMHNIILIGMPAAGKSTVGVILAKLLGYDFLDTDLLIQLDQRRRLSDIIAQEGIDAFLAIEERICAGLQVENTVIATGGSAVYGPRAMAHLRALGTVVYLSVPYEVLARRLSDVQGRGVVLRRGQTLVDLYEERRVLYEGYADITLEESGSLEDTVRRLAELCGGSGSR